MENNNKLIAEFMGYDIITEAEKDKFPTVLTTKDVKYHTSWDWLMPVVQKCYKIDNEEGFDNLVDAVSTLDIEATYNAVVEFINQQNK